jgi:hypothetical protein
MKLISILTVSTLLFACGPDPDSDAGSSITSDTEVTSTDSILSIQGSVQKGPFVNGTAININELTNDLISNGNSYITQITNPKGEFSYDGEIKAPFVEITSDGYFYDELTGGLSYSPIILRALAEASRNGILQVNLATTAVKGRIVTLVGEGMKFVDAKIQAEKELFAVFNIHNLTTDASSLNIIGSNPEDAALLAISTIIMQVASDRANTANEKVAELALFLAQLDGDLSVDGIILSSSQIAVDIVAASASIDVSVVTSNLEKIYSDFGYIVTTPQFSLYIDKDKDGLLSKDDDDTPDSFVFLSFTDSDATNVYSTNQVTLAGMAVGGVSFAALELSSNISSDLYVNGSKVVDFPASLQNSDIIELKSTIAKFSATGSITLKIGGDSFTSTISTRKPKIAYKQGLAGNNYNGGCPGDGTFAGSNGIGMMIAVPFLNQSDIVVSWVGAGLTQGQTLSLYTDNGGVVGTKIATSQLSNGAFSGSTILDDDNSDKLIAGSYISAKFDTPVSLSAGTKYWLVGNSSSKTCFGSTHDSTQAIDFSSVRTSMDGVIWKDAIPDFAYTTVKLFFTN